MTDTEILDYLQESYTMNRGLPHDCTIGSVNLTLGLRPGNIRDLMIAGIEQDKARAVARVTAKLTGEDAKAGRAYWWRK